MREPQVHRTDLSSDPRLSSEGIVGSGFASNAAAWTPAGPRFACPGDRDSACEALARAGFVVVEIEGIGPSMGGRLGDVIDEAIERELRASGAAGPGMADLTAAGDTGARRAALGNQLYRARSAGALGIAVVLGPLRAAAGTCGALHPSDCSALRSLAGASRSGPVVLMLDSRDARTVGYADPAPLERILAADAQASSASGSEPPCITTENPSSGAEANASGRRSLAAVPPSRSPDLGDGLAAGARPHATAPVARDAPEPGRALPSPPASIGGSSAVAGSASAVSPDIGMEWEGWVQALAMARGPQALGALEKLFTDSYVPLGAALASGLGDPRAKSVHDDFRNAFVRSYTDAFATFAATTKRPRMTLDVHDVASRIARLHGARSTRLLLIDAMRWDVSRWVSERLAAKLGSRAVLASELLLWSALPTKTARQLETIARGVEALRAPAELEPDGEPTRGRTSEYVRRMRVGPRELHKLDIVEARLAAARGAVLRSLPEISEATAEVVARHVDTLPPHTLLFVFGDHGFTIDRAGCAKQGGASPEEVICGAFALLVGDVH